MRFHVVSLTLQYAFKVPLCLPPTHPVFVDHFVSVLNVITNKSPSSFLCCDRSWLLNELLSDWLSFFSSRGVLRSYSELELLFVGSHVFSLRGLITHFNRVHPLVTSSQRAPG